MKGREHEAKEAQRDSGTPKPRSGGFRLDGSWDEAGTWQTPLGEFVRLLINGRRFGYRGYPPYKASPADLARMIREGPFPDSFGDLRSWDALEARRDWPYAHATTSTAQAVILCGWGQIPGEWEECSADEKPSSDDTGRFIPNEKALAAWNSEVSRYQDRPFVGQF